MKKIDKHIISIIVDNEFGALARVVELFSARGCNIESLSVSIVDEDKNLSRITIITIGTKNVIELLIKLLKRIIPVHTAVDLSEIGPHVECSLALVKVKSIGDKRVEALRIADIFRSQVIDSTHQSFIFQVVGKDEKINSFIELMKPLGLVEVCRTGVASLTRGEHGVID